MAPARESGTASAAVGGALWAAATWGPPLPLLLILPPGGIEVAAELGDTLLAALGGERFPFGFSGAAAGTAAGSDSVVSPFDLVPVEDDGDGDEDIGACSGRGCATSGGCAAGLFFFWGLATQKVKRRVIRKALRIRISYPVAKGWARSRVMLNIGEEKA